MSDGDNNVWLQPGTRAHMLVYRPMSHSWQVWTATDKRSGNSDTWLGTFMEVFPTGQCTQHVRTETEVRDMEIRPAVVEQSSATHELDIHCINHPRDGEWIHHIDGNLRNNDPSNLELVKKEYLR
jgi:hypothetical protein